jgi:hypothetical protein
MENNKGLTVDTSSPTTHTENAEDHSPSDRFLKRATYLLSTVRSGISSFFGSDETPISPGKTPKRDNTTFSVVGKHIIDPNNSLICDESVKENSLFKVKKKVSGLEGVLDSFINCCNHEADYGKKRKAPSGDSDVNSNFKKGRLHSPQG